VLYGLIVGNKGWLQVRLDHPELLGLGETEAARQIYQLAFEAFVADPLRAVTGALRAWRQYFSYTWRGIFGFIPGHEARLIAIILSSLGLAYCLRHWREMPYSMILAMVVGVVLSVPFVPPIDSDSMRIYAATIPLTALLVALGVAFFLPRHGAKELPGGYVSPRIAASYGALMILVTFAGSITIKLLNEPAAYQSRACPAGQDNLYVRMTKGSSIQLVANEARAQTHVPEVRISDFKEGMHAYRRWYPALHSELENLQAGQEIRFAINLVRNRHGEPLWLMSDARTTPKTGVVRICARLSDNKAHKFYYAQEIQVIPESGF
ncbi:MAG: hypothetical protein ACRES4_10115, partial [Nevskiales bacterium]